MGKEYEVKVTPYAPRQMQETVHYIAATLQSSDNAANWLDTVKKELASLSTMPARIPLTEEEPWHSQGVHKMVVKNFLVYFWIDDENLCVWVTAIVYSRRNQRQQLEQMEPGKSELYALLEKGAEDIRQGRTVPAKPALSEIRKELQ